MPEESGSPDTAAQSFLERGAEALGQAEQVVTETYGKAKNYSNENPGKSILLALGIGVGMGFLLGASSRRSHSNRFAQPVVNALSDIAMAFFPVTSVSPGGAMKIFFEFTYQELRQKIVFKFTAGGDFQNDYPDRISCILF